MSRLNFFWAVDRSVELFGVKFTIGSLVLGILLALHGIIQPFKSKFKNVQELVMLLNFQGLYMSLLYSATNTIAVKVLIALAFTQLFSVSAYHIKKVWND